MTERTWKQLDKEDWYTAEMGDFAVHVAKVDNQGEPALLIQAFFVDEQQRQDFLDDAIRMTGDCWPESPA